MFRRIRNRIIRGAEPASDPVAEREETDGETYRPSPNGDSAFRRSLQAELIRYGFHPDDPQVNSSSIEHLSKLSGFAAKEFTERERDWMRNALSPEEQSILYQSLASSSIGGESTIDSRKHPSGYWGPLSNPKLPREIKRKLLARGLEVVKSPMDLHFILMNAIDPKNNVIEQSERDVLLQRFIENRIVAARIMDRFEGGRPPFMGEDLIADPLVTEWPEYQRVFFELKADFSRVDEWKEAREHWHAFWKLDHEITSTYKRRDEIGVEPTIPICRAQIALASTAKQALKRDHELMHMYRAETQARYLRRRGSDPEHGWMPKYREFQLPEHRGFKQLAIIYDKMKDYESAIDVCKEAQSVDWPGDWDVRIARYERRLANQRK